MSSLLVVSHLRVAFPSGVAVRDVSFDVACGERVALVGESGSGKSISTLALTRLPPTDEAEVSGEVIYDGRSPRRGEIAYVFQDHALSLNPVMRIESQLRERPRGAPKFSRDFLAGMLAQVGLPAEVLRAYPFELSGGMRQRVMIAAALAADARLLIADEPTTALDVTTQADVMDLIERVVRERKMALLMATHNLALVSRRFDRVFVMRRGEVVESGAVRQVVDSPTHEYTKALIAAVPRMP